MALYFDPEFGMEMKYHITPGTAILGSALISAGGNILGSIFGSRGSSGASDTMTRLAYKAHFDAKDLAEEQLDLQEKAWAEQVELAREQLGLSREQLGFQREMWAVGREDVAPWREAGGWAVSELKSMLESGPDPTKIPGYEFFKSEGIKAAERGAAARGGQLSGAQLKALDRFGTDYATGQWQNYLSPYFQLAGYGASPVMGSAGISQGGISGYPRQITDTSGNYLMQAGQAQASNQLTQGQLWGNLASNLGGIASNTLLNYGLYGGGQQQNQLAQQATAFGAAPGTYYAPPYNILS